jgi:branched-chain amino acid transport system substrate-binding protein
MKPSTGFTRRAGLGLLAAAPLLGRGLDNDISIGALLSLTGDWSTLGIASRALLEIAVAEINNFLALISAPGRVRLLVEDTKLDPNAAVNSVRVLAGQGVKLIIGPQSSAEARAILPVLAENDMIAISQGSTAGSLSLPGDNLFRFVPDDAVEAVAIVAMALARGMKTIVPAWRNDPGNAGLAIAARRLFTAAGGTVTAGVQYGTENVNFGDVARQIATQAAGGPAGKTAVFLASFDEVVDMFRSAGSVSGLGDLPWYGTDGAALNAPLAADKQAAAFATKVGFVAPTLLRPDLSKPKWQPLVDAVVTKTKLDPDAFALAAYDACWCGMIARLLNGGTYVATMKPCLMQAAETYFGATGWGRLNANGDRAYGDFEFWGLDGSAKWVPRAMYEAGVFTTVA